MNVPIPPDNHDCVGFVFDRILLQELGRVITGEVRRGRFPRSA